MSAAKAVFEGMAQFMGYLESRWQDEKEYEGFDGYEKAMEKSLDKLGATFTKATKRPFACYFDVDGQACQIIVTNQEIKLLQVEK